MVTSKYHREPIAIRLHTVRGSKGWHDGIAAAALLTHPRLGEHIQAFYLDCDAKAHTLIMGVPQTQQAVSAAGIGLINSSFERDCNQLREAVLRVWTNTPEHQNDGISIDILAEKSGI